MPASAPPPLRRTAGAPASPTRPGLLVIFDGLAWGEPGHPCNAVEIAHTPTLDRLRRECPHTEVVNNGPAVGLPAGQMGNSEVGHLHIGAGRLVEQDFARIEDDIAAGAFGRDGALGAALDHVKATGGRLHLMGLLGPGGVHAHERHFGAALHAAARAGVRDVWVHPVGDGRDTPPRSALGFLDTLHAQMAQAGVGRVADFVGRYFAMDRDQRWERTEAAYHLYTRGGGSRADSARAAVEAAYQRGEGDEFVTPTLVDPDGVLRDGDAAVWLNFRPDRSRQITRTFKQPDFTHFDRTAGGGGPGGAPDVLWVCMTQYDRTFGDWPGLAVAYAPQGLPMTLAEHIAGLGLRQFHTAETEKYAHVTYFLNGGREAPWPGEDRALVPSPRVATYDLAPKMSAGQVTDEVLQALGGGGYDLVVVNYANPDMVGHTGDLAATVQAMEYVDNMLHRVVTVAKEMGYVTLVTSDHGNAEEMCTLGPDGRPGEPVTKHSLHPSPLLVATGGEGVRLRAGGSLANVAPTLLDLMGLPIPSQMTAESLVERA